MQLIELLLDLELACRLLMWFFEGLPGFSDPWWKPQVSNNGPQAKFGLQVHSYVWRKIIFTKFAPRLATL